MGVPRAVGTMPERTRAGEWLPRRHPPTPPTARSELDDPGEAPGNLAKIIAPPADFPKQSLCLPAYRSNQEARGCGTRARRPGSARLGRGIKVYPPLQFLGNQWPQGPGQKVGIEAKGLWPGRRTEGVLIQVLFPPRKKRHPLPFTEHLLCSELGAKGFEVAGSFSLPLARVPRLREVKYLPSACKWGTGV